MRRSGVIKPASSLGEAGQKLSPRQPERHTSRRDIDVRFDIQLEGSSFIGFSPEPNPMNSVVVRTPQWKVQPI
jgi:hypothetical protein